MAKGQKRSNREPKKPKAAKKPTGPTMAAAQSQPARYLSKPGSFGRKPG